jgi:hypothetical protein
MKSVSGFASFAATTVPSSIVSPILTTTEPSACLASLPVSISIWRPSASVMILRTALYSFFSSIKILNL